MKSRLWRWYKRHDKALSAILDIACDLVPGGKIVLNALKLAHGAVADKLENKEERVKKNQETKKQQEQVEQLLTDIKPLVIDLVEDVEDLDEFKKAKSLAEVRQILEKSVLKEDLKEVITKISPSISASIAKMSSKRVLNDKYELIRCIGSGGQGDVYQAFHKMANIYVAVKLLPKTLRVVTPGLQKEYYHVIANLIHNNIVQYRDIGQDKETKQIFLVMDFVEGENLREVFIKRGNKPYTFEEATTLLQPIANALDFAHKNKIVHCDLKPENILIRKNDGHILLTDFGLAREIKNSLSMQKYDEKNIAGTLSYMSPEQYLGKPPVAQSDIWALGVILYEMLTGSPPFQGVSFDHYMKLVCDIEPEYPESLDPKAKTLLKRMLKKDKNERPQKATKSFILSSEQKKEVPVIPEIIPLLPDTPVEKITTPPRGFQQQVQQDTWSQPNSYWANNAHKTPKKKSGNNVAMSIFSGCFLFFLFIMICVSAGIYDPEIAAVIAVIGTALSLKKCNTFLKEFWKSFMSAFR